MVIGSLRYATENNTNTISVMTSCVGFQLRRRIDGMTEPVRWNGKAIFDKRNAPACDDDEPKRPVGKLQMAVPGKRHEDIRHRQ